VATRAKISDVAALAGVSSATVSRVLNGNSRVDADITDRVNMALATLKYRRNRLASGLRQQRNNVIGAVIPDVSNPFFTDVVRGIEDGVRAAGFLLVLCNSDDDPNKENAYLELLVDQQAAGIILAPASTTSTGMAEARDGGVRMVVIDRSLEGQDVDTVVLDNATGAEALTRELLEQAAIVAHIGGPRRTSTAVQRLAGYQDALAGYGRAFVPELAIESDYTEQGGYEAMEQLLRLSPRPDAVFVGNNVMTIGVLRRLAESSDERSAVALASFDPLPWSADPERAVRVLDHPSYHLGALAAGLMMAGIEEPSTPPQTVVLPSGNVV